MVRLVLLIAAIVLAMSLPATGATTGFLKLDGVDGESIDPKHEGEIEIQAWSWGVSQTSSVSSGQATGRRQHEPIRIVKQIDKSSPQLARACANGTHIKDAKLTLRRAGAAGEAEEYLIIELQDVLVSSTRIGCCDNDCDDTTDDLTPYEEMTITYGKIRITEVRSGAVYDDVWSPRSN